MARRPPGPRTSARWLGGALVAVLAVAAIVLAVIAVNRVRGPQVSAQPDPAPTFSFGAAPTSSPTPTPSSTPAPTYPRAEERFLSVGSGGMWRGIAGECGGAPPLIERSVDGGETWEDVTPNYRGIGQVLSLDSFAGTEAEAITRVGAACETQALRTFTQGEFWEPYPEVLATSRYLDPATPSTLLAPQGSVATPCADPRSVRASGNTVALICDGTGFVLRGAEWLSLPTPGVAAMSVSRGDALVAARSAACEGLEISVLSVDAFSEVRPLGCVAVDPAAPVAVASTGDGALVWSGDTLLRVP